MDAVVRWVLVLFTMKRAGDQLAENRRLGIKTNWSKTFVTLAGCFLVAAIGIACLLVCVAFDDDALEFILFGVVYVVGLTALCIYVNRRWPARTRG